MPGQDTRQRGRRQDDPAVLLGAGTHGADSSRDPEDHTVEIDAYRTPIVGQIERPDVTGPMNRDAGVEECQVDAAELPGTRSECSVDLLGIGHVALHCNAVQRFGNGGGGNTVDVDHAQAHALGGELLRGRKADARRPAGYQCDAARQVQRLTTARPARRPASTAGCTTGRCGSTCP
jgi:hypothetical protein